MRTSSTAPRTGQFVAVWSYSGSAWSATFRWDGGILLERNSTLSVDWQPSVGLPQADLNPTYFVE